MTPEIVRATFSFSGVGVTLSRIEGGCTFAAGGLAFALCVEVGFVRASLLEPDVSLSILCSVGVDVSRFIVSRDLYEAFRLDLGGWDLLFSLLSLWGLHVSFLTRDFLDRLLRDRSFRSRVLGERHLDFRS